MDGVADEQLFGRQASNQRSDVAVVLVEPQIPQNAGAPINEAPRWFCSTDGRPAFLKLAMRIAKLARLVQSLHAVCAACIASVRAQPHPHWRCR